MRLYATRKVDVAVRALRVLAENGQRNGTELADRLDTSVGFLAQVLAPMIRAGWVLGLPGPGGGYRLVAPLGLSLREVVETIEGPLEDGTCVFRGDECRPTDPCVLHDVVERTRETALHELACAPVFSTDPDGDHTVPVHATPQHDQTLQGDSNHE